MSRCCYLVVIMLFHIIFYILIDVELFQLVMLSSDIFHNAVLIETTDIEENLKTVKICCDCLQRIVAANSSDDESRHYLSSFLISSIINLLLRGATSEQPHCVITEWDAVYHMSSVISIIVCSLSKE